MSPQARSTARRTVLCSALAAFACIAALIPASATAASASIAGTVTAEKGGAPLEGVLVCAYLVSGEEFEETCEPSAADGKYLIDGLGAGEYKVEFWPGFSRLNYFPEYYDDRELWETADRIEVGAGAAVTGIDAALEEGAQIKGVVTAAGKGTPLEEARVCAYGEESIRCTFTDPDGEYVLAPLPADQYKVEFWTPEANYIPQYFDNRDSFKAADPIALVLGETETGVDAALKPGGLISGIVVSALNGAPLQEVLVCSIEATSDELYGCAETNGAGQYSLWWLNTDVYKVGFSIDIGEWFGEPGEEFEDGYSTQFYNAKTALAAADPLSITAPAAIGGINAQLNPTAGPSSQLLPGPSIIGPANPKSKPKKKHCRRGFKLKKVKGKRRCVKIHKGKHRPPKHRSRLRP